MLDLSFGTSKTSKALDEDAVELDLATDKTTKAEEDAGEPEAEEDLPVATVPPPLDTVMSKGTLPRDSEMSKEALPLPGLDTERSREAGPGLETMR